MRTGVRRRVAFAVLAALIVSASGFGAVVVASGTGMTTFGFADSKESIQADSDRVCPSGAALESEAELQPQPGPSPRIVGLYPNPTTHRNVGEYVVLEFPTETRVDNWTLTDGHTTASLPNETVTGRVAASVDPNVTEALTDESVLGLEGSIRLAADGDRLELRNGTRSVDAVRYERAPAAERWYRSASADTSDDEPSEGRWWPRDATCLGPSSTEVDDATVFVLPDAPDVPRETLREADERLLLAGYTVTSDAVADELVAAAERGVDVSVLFESGPVGGTPAATEPVLERLEAAGVDVRVIGGEGARYRYHHPKYAVVDDSVLVTSENWKPSGIGGESSRGWGVRLEDPALAADLATVFRADFDGWDTQTGAAFRENATFVTDEGEDEDRPSDGATAFPTNHDPATVPVESAELLVAPDNAEPRVADLIENADDEILVKQASIDGEFALLEAVLDAARRGVEVDILLDSTWYHEDENAAVADRLERVAEEEGLPLEVRLADGTGRFEKIHAKGIVIDREVAVVGSANWNENSFRNNREVLLALHGDAAAEYYATVFGGDWEGDSRSLPIGTAVGVVLVLAVAAIVGRRYVRFGDGPGRGSEQGEA
ncbi:phospholipase D-like domain-containing protein [Halopiger xanaduensis]|uniref:Phospholipase D/Transphosphatidylase n=1 Tax=Halopiger xanaduensis (strain DSM 18323 / JCM 14033 / SH-6) TaxID=797210 RepID=F8D484_HALXS|nr:phospholipase D-like domain-containing protein [Halopiger xanaduensis]AEH37485.1 phospholipase D/Transphosphatidylase [Halopiger xanaduensis SH-6]